MGGVDRMDQLRSYYNVGRSGRRWWKYLFWGLLNVGIINAKILWSLCNRPLPANQRIFSLKSFKMKLIHNLGDDYIIARQPQAPVLPVVRLEGDYTVSEEIVNHPLVHFPGRGRVCRVCSREHKKTTAGGQVESRFGCQVCNVYLCKTGGCFEKYHS